MAVHYSKVNVRPISRAVLGAQEAFRVYFLCLRISTFGNKLPYCKNRTKQQQQQKQFKRIIERSLCGIGNDPLPSCLTELSGTVRMNPPPLWWRSLQNECFYKSFVELFQLISHGTNKKYCPLQENLPKLKSHD